MSFGLERVYSSAPKDQVFPNIVCIHGYGVEPESTWHHGETGKSWIDDTEFLQQLKGSCRVFSFVFNGDLSANLSAAALAFHAYDLLLCLEQALINGNVGPIFFIAHSWGGIVAKKAIQLCWTLQQFPCVKRMSGGMFFMGTPHIAHDVGMLLQAIRATIAAHHPQEREVSESEVRQYTAAVCKVNDLFARGKPPILHIRSFWEQQPTRITRPSGEAYEKLIVSKEYAYAGLESNSDSFVDCSHADLARFPGVLDARFSDFISKLNHMITEVLTEDDFSDLPALLKVIPKSVPDNDSDATSGSSSGSETPKEVPDSPEKVPAAAISEDKADELYRCWQKRSADVEYKAQRTDFLRSLYGWTESNTGSDISVAPHTCEWFAEEPDFKSWRTGHVRDSLIYLGEAGQGKTYLARKIVDYLRLAHPSDIVLSFFCSPDDKQPSIWEYFTRELLSRDIALFGEVPFRYRDRDETSPPLSLGSFLDIWRRFRGAGSWRCVYLVVDALEQCDGECFEEFSATMEKIQMPVGISENALSKPPSEQPTSPTILKVLFTCRNSPAVTTRRSSAAEAWISPISTAKDIATFVDWRLQPLSRGEEGEKPEESNPLAESIKRSAGCYWPFAKFAVEQVEQSHRLPPKVIFDSGDCMPTGLKESLERQVQSCVRSMTDVRHMNTIVTAVASLEPIALKASQIADMLKAIHRSEELRDLSVAKLVSANSGNLFLAGSDNHITFVHESVAHCMTNILSPEQRHVNMAFICLNYLLRDSFRYPLPLYKKDKTRSKDSEEWIMAKHPFYDYAASKWLGHLRAAKDLAIQLLPFVRAFLDNECEQYRTWCSWSDWRYTKPYGASSHTDPAALVLLQGGCTNILQHFIPPPKKVHDGHLKSAVRSWNPTYSWTSKNDDFLEATGWPEVTNGIGQTGLMVAIHTGRPDVIDFVLQWEPRVNACSMSGQTPLIAFFVDAAANHTDLPLGLIEELLCRGANPNAGDGSGMTPLHYACAMGELEATRLLLSHGASVNIADTGGSSPLQEAFSGRNAKLFAELIEHGADVDALWSTGQVPLSQCIIENDLEIFNILIDVADVNRMNGDGVTPILVACDLPNRHEHIRLLLSRPDLDLDIVDRNRLQDLNHDRRNALSVAAFRGNYLATELLLSAGAYPGSVPGLTALPLYYAVQAGEHEIARILLTYQSPVNNYTHRRRYHTPLSAAVRKKDADMVSLLLEHGSDPTIEDGYGDAGPLWRALDEDEPNLEIIRKILEARVPPNMSAVREGDEDIITMAVRTGNVDIVRMIVEHGADLSSWLPSSKTLSPLHTAAECGFVEICDIILQHEPRLLNAQAAEGLQNESPLIAACHGGHPDVVRFLLEKGARADQVSFHYNESALLIACDTNNYECVKLLLEAAPEMVNVAAYNGCSPLIFACEGKDLRIMEELLKAGADISHRDIFGNSCISNSFSAIGNKRPGSTMELLMRYGLDINAVQSASGLTVLGAAILNGSHRDVKWLLEHGADPLRCQRLPRELETWDNALQLAIVASSWPMVDFLLGPQRGLLEHLVDNKPGDVTFWNGLGLLRVSVENLRRVYIACDGRRTETGTDAFADLIRQPNANGYTLLDLALERTASTPQIHRKIGDRVGPWIRELMALEYDRGSHVCLVEDIGWNLLMRGGFDSEAITLLTAAISIPGICWGEEEISIVPEAWSMCGSCRGRIRGSSMACRLCTELRCADCVDVSDTAVLHRHEWVEIPVQLDLDWKPQKVQTLLESVHDALVSPSQTLSPPPEIPDNGSDEPAEESSSSEKNAQTSLQLATLHAFGYLAIRRPLFTPYLPLSPATEDVIAPWMPMIKDQRRFVERNDLAFEMHWSRRLEEVMYLQRGLGVGYADEEDVTMGWVIRDVRNLYQLPSLDEEPEPRVEEDRAESKGG